MKKLIEIINKKERHIIGVMSGTSLDGVDLVLVKCSGAGANVQIDPISFASFPMPEEWRLRIRKAFKAETAEICAINYDLGKLFSDLIIQFCRKAAFPIEKIDAIGLHGQTLYHIHRHSTLQSGESEIVAQTLKCIVVSDFRSADVALGGSGAPLVPYLDKVLFQDKKQNTALINLGGIANITYLPKNLNENILAFDIGPANSILNETVEKLTQGKSNYDKDAFYSSQGAVHSDLLGKLLQHPYFKLPLPKSTGREQFGFEYVNSIIHEHLDLNLHDLLRTFISLVATSVKEACTQHFPNLDKIYISGGGAHHPLLMEEIRNQLGPQKVEKLEGKKGISADSKEAIAFALLAHERLNGTPTNLPGVTGAKDYASLGKLTIPFIGN